MSEVRASSRRCGTRCRSRAFAACGSAPFLEIRALAVHVGIGKPAVFDIVGKWRKAAAKPHAGPATASAPRSGHRAVNWWFWLICLSLIAIVTGQSGYTVWKDRQSALALQRRDVANVSLVLAAQTSRYFGVFDTALQNLQRLVGDT